MKQQNKFGIVGICLALALGCQPKGERYQRDGIVQNYAPANGYDIKFGPAVRGYNIAIGDLTENGFSDTYILAKDIDKDGHIDYFEIFTENKMCYQSDDAPQRLDFCKIDSNLKELASTTRLNQLEEGLLHERR